MTRAAGSLRAVPLLAGLVSMLLILAGPAAAQMRGQAAAMPVVTVEQARLYSGSLYGQTLQRAMDAEAEVLAGENRRIEAELEAEERDLTTRRAGLPPDEFRSLADAFDAKAEGIRTTQAGKERMLIQRRDALVRTFYDRIRPVLADMMVERGAFVIIEKQDIFLAFERIDITDAAIARLDQVMGDGSGPRRALGQPQPQQGAAVGSTASGLPLQGAP